jgi:hypothetical protein
MPKEQTFVASYHRWREVTLAAYRNFPYAPPDYPGAPFRARLPQPPYDGAEGWKCSVYYFWWEYLRRHDGYRETCLNGGVGEYAELYGSFGDVHATGFNDWWWLHFELFTFSSEAQTLQMSRRWYIECEGIFLHVGYARSKSEMISGARDEINKLSQKEINERIQRDIRFKPAARPVLKSLYQHLLVWDAKQQHPELGDPELCDISGLEVNLPFDSKDIEEMKANGSAWRDLEKANRRAKSLAVQRHLRIARQYIDNVVHGQFPQRGGR